MTRPSTAALALAEQLGRFFSDYEHGSPRCTSHACHCGLDDDTASAALDIDAHARAEVARVLGEAIAIVEENRYHPVTLEALRALLAKEAGES